jgi:hypothetical protein
MGELARASRVALLLLLAVAAGGCSFGSPSTFTLNGASVDSTYICPAGANNAPYDLHANVDVRNGTSNGVTIDSVTAVMTLAAIKGGWLDRVGYKYMAEGVTFSPDRVGPGSAALVKVTIPSACTNGKSAGDGSTYGEYSVALTITTTSGRYAIDSKNRHRIVA